MTQKIFFSIIFDMGTKTAEFDAEFESVKKWQKSSKKARAFVHSSTERGKSS
jgi:hypothetical protein